MKKKATSKASKKEVYRLWYEYLKRSDTYKKYCEWVRRFQTDFKTLRPKECTNNMDAIFAMFGDVHKEPFSKWWESHKKIIGCLKYEGINDYSKFIEEEMEGCISDFQSKKGKEPTLQEFKKHFSERMGNNKDFVYLCIAIGGRTRKDLVKQFDEIIGNTLKERENNPHLNNHERQYRTNLTLISNTISKDTYLRVDEIKRYIEVYDLRKKELSIQEIIRHFYPNHKEKQKDENIQRAIYQDLQRARNIIKNVENGYFPGEYQP